MKNKNLFLQILACKLPSTHLSATLLFLTRSHWILPEGSQISKHFTLFSLFPGNLLHRSGWASEQSLVTLQGVTKAELDLIFKQSWRKGRVGVWATRETSRCRTACPCTGSIAQGVTVITAALPCPESPLSAHEEAAQISWVPDQCFLEAIQNKQQQKQKEEKMPLEVNRNCKQ